MLVGFGPPFTSTVEYRCQPSWMVAVTAAVSRSPRTSGLSIALTASDQVIGSSCARPLLTASTTSIATGMDVRANDFTTSLYFHEGGLQDALGRLVLNEGDD